MIMDIWESDDDVFEGIEMILYNWNMKIEE